MMMKSIRRRATAGSGLCSGRRLEVLLCCLVLLVLTGPVVAKNDDDEKNEQPRSTITVTTWNVGVASHNPFEYWITYNNSNNNSASYEYLMIMVEEFMEDPVDKDVSVSSVFTDEMFTELDKRFQEDLGWKSMRPYWEEDYRNRRIVSGFLLDETLGLKRLASMPDRYTNTILLQDGSKAFRPTVINWYQGDLSGIDQWWSAWQDFMFHEKILVDTRYGMEEEKAPFEILTPIKKAKYPVITYQEEEDSLPLQTLCLAILDAVLVHMMNTIAEPAVWQDIKRTMVEAWDQKTFTQLKILDNEYDHSDIITLQMVSAEFVNQTIRVLGDKFHVVVPEAMDRVRDQNSIILLRKETFPAGPTKEITDLVSSKFPEGAMIPVAGGDVFALTTTNKDGVPYVVVSFHGDTNGLATIPVLNAVVAATRSLGGGVFEDHRLIFGLDANTYEHAIPGRQQDVLEFSAAYKQQGLTSCWGDTPNPANHTTFHARSYLQRQWMKACKHDDLLVDAYSRNVDRNPKDFILFPKDQFQVHQTWKDNTGQRNYVEDMVFPTLTFPSCQIASKQALE